MARRPPRKPFDPEINRAVALKYARGEADAPRVTAKGEGLLADKIIEVARAHGVEVRSDRDLVRLLDTVDIDSPIPLEAFQAVAEILSYIYRRQDKLKPPKSGDVRER